MGERERERERERAGGRGERERVGREKRQTDKQTYTERTLEREINFLTAFDSNVSVLGLLHNAYQAQSN